MNHGVEPIARLIEGVDRTDPGGVLALYLYGSAVTGGLCPDSDIDLLIITQRSLDTCERRMLLDILLAHSGSRATTRPGRPIELTSVVRSDVVPWTYPPRCDFLYGEWLRDQSTAGHLPEPHPSPDLTVAFTTIFTHVRVLRGPAPSDIVTPAPAGDLRRAMRECLDPLLGDLVGDERNVLLTLARMLVTARTGQILAKDAAALEVLPVLDAPDRALMELAADAYRGEREDRWDDRRHAVALAAQHLADLIRAALA